MRISDPLGFFPGLCGHAGGLGLAIEKWKKIEFEKEGEKSLKVENPVQDYYVDVRSS